jgi:hypothetical protein
MARAYNVVDADGHLLEPLDLWERYMDPAFRAPRIVKDNATGKGRLRLRPACAHPRRCKTGICISCLRGQETMEWE